MSINEARSSYVRSIGTSSSVIWGNKLVCNAIRIARDNASKGWGTSVDRIWLDGSGEDIPHNQSTRAMPLSLLSPVTVDLIRMNQIVDISKNLNSRLRMWHYPHHHPFVNKTMERHVHIDEYFPCAYIFWYFRGIADLRFDYDEHVSSLLSGSPSESNWSICSSNKVCLDWIGTIISERSTVGS